ncbi:glutathione S-transferase [Aureimonas sp. ME7]|uniref:glutathione S-transferase family protein n=1 Tax=Aureimonas sp. ME7 TaxID=2744252 RepID=UPI0015F6C59E|nr:glutathione S-transferase [Aureimonas sp. ME7]
MITIHHLENSRSQRVLWLLEELGVPYDVKRYERLPSLQGPPELRAVHPLGKSPVLTDGELTIAETGAIVTYLLDRYGEGRLVPPQDKPEYWRYQHFLHHAEGSAMPPLFLKLVLSRIPPGVPFFVRPILAKAMQAVDDRLLDPQIANLLDYWNEALADGWFAGAEFSAADVMMSFPLEAAGARIGFGNRPRLSAFLAKIHARSGYEAALQRGGPYAYA